VRGVALLLHSRAGGRPCSVKRPPAQEIWALASDCMPRRSASTSGTAGEADSCSDASAPKRQRAAAAQQPTQSSQGSECQPPGSASQVIGGKLCVCTGSQDEQRWGTCMRLLIGAKGLPQGVSSSHDCLWVVPMSHHVRVSAQVVQPSSNAQEAQEQRLRRARRAAARREAFRTMQVITPCSVLQTGTQPPFRIERPSRLAPLPACCCTCAATSCMHARLQQPES